jgi:hypothetical protein
MPSKGFRISSQMFDECIGDNVLTEIHHEPRSGCLIEGFPSIYSGIIGSNKVADQLTCSTLESHTEWIHTKEHRRNPIALSPSAYSLA